MKPENCHLSTGPEPGTAAWWDARYRSGDIPWDTGVVPPEVVELVASGRVIPGWALDLGCGSGLNSRYLARHGWHVVGIDLAYSALRRAREQALREGVPAYFCLGDVSALEFLAVKATFALDVGCFHAVAPARRHGYVTSLARLLLPGAFYLLYAFEGEVAEGGDSTGITPFDIARFAPLFVLCWAQHGYDRQRRAGWYLLRRTGAAA